MREKSLVGEMDGYIKKKNKIVIPSNYSYVREQKTSMLLYNKGSVLWHSNEETEALFIPSRECHLNCETPNTYRPSAGCMGIY